MFLFGFAVGLEFPRLELSLGHPATGGLFKTYAFLTLDQYANGMFTPGTTLTADIPPCQRADIQVSAIAGYNFDCSEWCKSRTRPTSGRRRPRSSSTTSPAR